MDNTFARRLVNARKIRCMSQRDLRDALNGAVSSSAIEKYEKGLMMPSSDVLILFSKALGMNLDYFFRPFAVSLNPSGFEFRKSSRLGVKQEESIKYTVCNEMEKYLEIEAILGISAKFSLDYSNVSVESEGDAVSLARRFRQDLDLGADAIVSAVELLESIGIKIIEIDGGGSFSGTCNKAGDIPAIVVNRGMASERKRLTIFHELGHLLLKCAPGVDKERMCNVFANEVLIPSDKFRGLIGEARHDISLVELQSVQKEYGVSVDALMIKARQLNIITDRRYVSYCKKKNALPEFKAAVESALYPAECTDRFRRLVYRALASDVISPSKAAALLETSLSQVRENLNLM